MVSWEWYSNPSTFCVWMHLLIEASHEFKVWKGVPIVPGELVTSVNSLSISTGLSIQQVRTALRNIQTTGEITIKTTNKYSIITICKYDEYQVLNGRGQQTKQQTDNKQSNNIVIIGEQQDISLSNNGGFAKPSVEDVRAYCIERGCVYVIPEEFINFYDSNGWMVGKNKMKDWKATVRNWEIKAKKGIYSSNKSKRRSTDVPTNPDYTQPF